MHTSFRQIKFAFLAATLSSMPATDFPNFTPFLFETFVASLTVLKRDKKDMKRWREQIEFFSNSMSSSRKALDYVRIYCGIQSLHHFGLESLYSPFGRRKYLLTTLFYWLHIHALSHISRAAHKAFPTTALLFQTGNECLGKTAP